MYWSLKLFALVFLCFHGTAFSHKKEIHQHITREAFKLLKKSFQDQLSELEHYLETNENAFSADYVDCP